MKVLIVLSFIITAFLSVLLSSCVGTETEDTKKVAMTENEQVDSSVCKEMDATFLVNVAEIYMMQIQLAQLAHTKSRNKKVKILADTMENLYTASLAELEMLAGHKNIVLPESTTNRGEEAYAKLNTEHRTTFDAAYGIMVIDTQQQALDSLRTDSCCDKIIKAWNKKIVQDIRHRLNMAVQYQEQP